MNSNEGELYYHSKGDILLELDMINKKWTHAICTREIDITNYYIESALLFYELNPYINGLTGIKKQYGASFVNSTIKEFYVDYRVQLIENPDIAYETGHFTLNNLVEYQYLFVWNRIDGKWFHEVDAYAKKSSHVEENLKINDARREWVKLANEHSALNLAKCLYNKDFVYYNRGMIYEGYENLANAYSYMDDIDFDINLEKNSLVMVKPDFAYEIGTWSNEASGSYIIIWQFRDKRWGIYLDSNW